MACPFVIAFGGMLVCTLRSPQHAPSFIAGACGEIAVPLGSGVRAAKAEAFALYALVVQHHGAAVKIRLTRADPVAAGGAQSLRARHRI